MIVGSTGDLAVVVTHLAADRKVAARQFAALVGHLSDISGPLVLLGDLNAGPAELAATAAAAGLSRVPTGPSFPAAMPTDPIDWIAIRGLEATGGRVVAVAGSDHLAVAADLRPSG